MSAARTSYAQAVRGYDEIFQRALGEQITRAIFEASIVTDANACAIRTGETDALVAVLATIIALRPEAKVPSQLRTLCEDIGKRLLQDVKSFREPISTRGFSAAPMSGGGHDRAS
jgi:hypothetical protein